MKDFFKAVLMSGGVLFFLGVLMFLFLGFSIATTSMKLFNKKNISYLDPGQDKILHLRLEGLIYRNEFFLDNLRTYAHKKNIKGVFIEIDSPGGVVGTSQELYFELKRIRDDLKKPVVVFVQNLAASGAFYAAMGASQIVATPGALLGSVGVIASFVNLEKLYTWAKVDRYSIITGKFKDSGADYRKMRDDEREFFKKLLNKSLSQFQQHISEGRNIPLEKVKAISDGSIFLGTDALESKFIDKIGTFSDSVKLIGKLSKLGDQPKLFRPKVKKEFLEAFAQLLEEKIPFGNLKDVRNKIILPKNLTALPLYLMPGVL